MLSGCNLIKLNQNLSYLSIFIDDVDEWGAIIKNQTESYNRLSNLQNMGKREMMNQYGQELTKEAQNRNEQFQRVPYMLFIHYLPFYV